MAKLLNEKSECKENTIEKNKEKLKFAPGSFFVVYENENNLRAAQMNMPCFENNNILYVPLYAFLNALAGIELISFSNDINKNIEIKSTIFKELTVIKAEKPYKEKPVIISDTISRRIVKPTNKADNLIFKDSVKSFNSKSYDTILNPSKYSIPSKLIK